MPSDVDQQPDTAGARFLVRDALGVFEQLDRLRLRKMPTQSDIGVADGGRARTAGHCCPGPGQLAAFGKANGQGDDDVVPLHPCLPLVVGDQGRGILDQLAGQLRDQFAEQLVAVVRIVERRDGPESGGAHRRSFLVRQISAQRADRGTRDLRLAALDGPADDRTGDPDRCLRR
jgi:hypothetical protein